MSLTTPPEPPRLNSSPQPSQPRPVNQKSTATATTTSTLESNNPPQRKRKRILQPLYEFRLKNPSPSPSHRPHTPHPPPPNSRDTQVLTRDEVDQKPWKYIGYKGYSDFISSENDFFILSAYVFMRSDSTRIGLRAMPPPTKCRKLLPEAWEEELLQAATWFLKDNGKSPYKAAKIALKWVTWCRTGEFMRTNLEDEAETRALEGGSWAINLVEMYRNLPAPSFDEMLARLSNGLELDTEVLTLAFGECVLKKLKEWNRSYRESGDHHEPGSANRESEDQFGEEGEASGSGTSIQVEAERSNSHFPQTLRSEPVNFPEITSTTLAPESNRMATIGKEGDVAAVKVMDESLGIVDAGAVMNREEPINDGGTARKKRSLWKRIRKVFR